MSIIDRRLTDKNKSSNIRKKYLGRIKETLKESVNDAVKNGSIKDLVSKGSKKVSIPGKGLKKPEFRYTTGGIQDHVFPGNKKFSKGDLIERPDQDSGEGGGNGASTEGEGNDNFSFELTQEEFFNIYFDGLELPNMAKKQTEKIIEYVPRRAGFSTNGIPAKLNILRSMKQSIGRHLALEMTYNREIELLEAELKALPLEKSRGEAEQHRADEIESRITELREMLQSIPFLADKDLRYNYWENKPQPITQAVMFCLMDVSGSMSEEDKNLAKRFYIFLALFLKWHYEHLDIVFVSHTQEAHEVTEDEFFYSTESGGTVVSSGLIKVKEIIKERFSPQHYNIFISQISDGDNYLEDMPVMADILTNDLLPITQYYTYIETQTGSYRELSRSKGSIVMDLFVNLQAKFKNLQVASLSSIDDVFPTFKKFTEEKGRMTKEYFIDSSQDWTFEKIQKVYDLLESIAKEKYGLDWYPNQLEIITFEQMLDAYARHGMPLGYDHWSFGETFVTQSRLYKGGHMNLAYEIVLNSSPCISYLMEQNTMLEQALVVAHAAFGHNHFFKNNYLFRELTDATDAEGIIDYLAYAKKYVKECEEKYGAEEVEKVLDAAHALERHGVDRYKRPQPLSAAAEEARTGRARELSSKSS
jgi:uncharacterized sporulation protein YeaH/YhbH (DUF444 family)